MYYVSRQHHWPDGHLRVEIVSPGREYSSPGQLVTKYGRLGEGEEFADPREAVEAAIKICRQWRKDIAAAGKRADGWPYLSGYSTGGGMWDTEPVTFAEAREWAKETWEKLPKCDGCGDPLPEKGKRWRADDWSGQEFCSESCADREREWQETESARLDAEAKLAAEDAWAAEQDEEEEG